MAALETIWREPVPVEVPAEIRDIAGHPLLAELLARRGLTTPQAARAFLDAAERKPADPRDVPGVDAAVERLRRAAWTGQRILVWGDFDADGQTATAVLVQALRDMGADPAWYLPDRHVESHGLNDLAVERARREGADLVLTCDCGIRDLEYIELLARSGIDTVVTDHHVPRDTFDGNNHPARAVVTPHLLPPGHPARGLAGVGVAYVVAAAMLEAERLPYEQFLDLVALGTVADVAPLVAENRHLVQRGLPALNAGARPGIAALLAVAGCHPSHAGDAGPAGWVLAPRLNAFGRLERADDALELLLTTDRGRADLIARRANELNLERQRLTDVVVRAACAVVEGSDAADATPGSAPSGIVSDNAIALGDPTWPLGIVGLAAGRLAETYARPVALASCPPGGPARISMRAGPWCDLAAVVAELAAEKTLAFHGGGHHGAAGGWVPLEHMQAFVELFERSAARQRPPGPLVREFAAEAEITLDAVDYRTCRALGRLGPFGAANRDPLMLIRRVSLLAPPRVLGTESRHLALVLGDDRGARARAVWWNNGAETVPRGPIDVLATLEAHDHAGLVETRLVVQAVRPSTSTVVVTSAQSRADDVEQARLRLRALHSALRQASSAAEDGVSIDALALDRATLEAGLACLAGAGLLHARLDGDRVLVEEAPSPAPERPTIPRHLFQAWRRALAG